MKRRKFITATTGSLLATQSIAYGFQNEEEDQQLIEWRIYTLTSGSKQKVLDSYLENALIPALNRNGAEDIGVFKDISKSEPVKVHLFIPYTDADTYTKMTIALESDKKYLESSAKYHAIGKESPVYSRIESSLLLGFKAMPRLKAPSSKKKFYELRVYESYSEDAGRRKIDMFNQHEVKLFEDLGFKAVFYSKMLTGKYMPALTYMVCFESMEEMEARWNDFRTSEGWAAIKDLPKYANSVSKIHKIFFEPLSYSQV